MSVALAACVSTVPFKASALSCKALARESVDGRASSRSNDTAEVVGDDDVRNSLTAAFLRYSALLKMFDR